MVVFDRNPEAVKNSVSTGAVLSESLEDLISKLTLPRAIWVMVPAGNPTEETLNSLAGGLEPGDILIDGGNSNFKDTIRRAEELRGKNLYLVDVGTSGGIWGLAEGYSMMIGGDKIAVERLRPIFETLAPAPDKGWGHVGPSGSGHFVKMVHNGIEYGMMESYAEGFSLLKRKDEFGLDLHQISEIWRYGSVVRSWLLDLTARTLADNPELKDIAPFVADSGEGRWTVFETIDLDVPAPVITLSLIQRLRSRDTDSFSDKFLAALRNQFGGHEIKREG
jgi:6-phosphogluconate dehydrogenase